MQEEARTQPNQAGDFITLSSIKNAFLDFFRFVFRAFDLLFLSIRKRLGLFLLGCLLGVIAVLLYRYFQPKYYTTEMILYHNDLSRKDYYEIIENLNTLLFTNSYDNFARELRIDRNEAVKVNAIGVLSMNDESLRKDTSTKTGQRFKIQLKLKEPAVPRVYQQALLDYLDNNPYLKKIKDGQKRVYQDKLAYIEKEQQKLDSLKTLYNSGLAITKMPATFYNNELNPADIYVQSNNLENQREAIRNWFNNQAEPVMLVDGFKGPRPSNRVPLKILIIIGLAGGIILGMIMCFLAAVRNMVR
jgi:hypothetical protein